MIASWKKAIALTLGIALLLSGLFLGLALFFTHRPGQSLKLQAIERTARILAQRGEYSRNLAVMGPIPADGTGVLGLLWIVDRQGQVLASSTSAPLPPEALPILDRLDRTQFTPQIFDAGSLPWRNKFFATPIPGKPSDTLVIQDLGRGPGISRVKTIGTVFLSLMFFVSLIVWLILRWILKQREALFLRIHEVERSKIELIRNLAHDIRTPLTSLRTASEALQQGSNQAMSASDRETLIRTTYDESIYLTRLVENLLFISELGADRRSKPRKIEAINITALTRKRVEHRQANPRGAEVQIHFESEMSELDYEVSDLHWSRLISNLLENAERHAKTRVIVRLCTLPGGFALEVLDDGPGLPESAIQTYGHQREVQRDPGEPSRFGLGTIIIRSIVEAETGKLIVCNRPTGGLQVRAEFRMPAETPAH